MRKIKSMHVINFQSYKDTLVEFDEGLNAFVGESNTGKSALVTKGLEYISWGTIMLEKRVGNYANSHWIQKKTKTGKVTLTGTTSVEVTFTDEITVKRSMDKKGTTYYVTYPDDREDLTLTGNNGKVPEVVQELFNFNNLNLANQFERIFLLHDTPGEIAKTLNKVCDMELPSKVLKEIKSDVRKVKGRQSLIEEDIEKLTDSLLDYNDLNTMEDELVNLDKLYTVSATTSATYKSMEEIYETLITTMTQLSRYSSLQEREKDITYMLTLVDTYTNIKDTFRLMESCQSDFEYFAQELGKLGDLDNKSLDINDLLALLNQKQEKEKLFNNMDDKLEQVKSLTKELKSLHTTDYISELEDLLTLTHRMDDLKLLYNSMTSSLEAVKTLSSNLKQVSENSIQLDSKLQEELKDGCPVCGRK